MKLEKFTCVLFLLMSGLCFAEQSVREIVDASDFEGGLIVHVGCGDGEITAKFYKEGRLVLGLDANLDNVARARAHFLEKGVIGHVVADRMLPGTLPLLDGMVNLVVVSSSRPEVTSEEILRVLAPEGIAFVRGQSGWREIEKPRPIEIDSWTHFLHGPDNNPVAADTVVGRPFHMRWNGEPRWQRSHDFLASMSALVSDGKKLFYIYDKGETSTMAVLPRWTLATRDAFNGVVLWEKAINQWEEYLRNFRSGPVHLPRSLVVADGRLYTFLGYDEPLVALDPASGKTVQTYADTEGVREILYAGGRLYLVIHEGRSESSYSEIPKRILVLDARTGKKLWEKKDTLAKDLSGATLAVGSGVAVYDARQSLECVDAVTGKQLWRSQRASPVQYRLYKRAVTVISGNTVFWAGRSDNRKRGKGSFLAAFDLKTGNELWRAPAQEVFNSPPEVFVIKEQVWSREGAIKGSKSGYSVARDLRTGKVMHRRPQDSDIFSLSGHAWCYMNKATERFLVRGEAGVEFLSTENNSGYAHHFIRGTCQYGILPCNGLLYVPPHSCACYINAKLNGFLALAPKSDSGIYNRNEPALEKGEAYYETSNLKFRSSQSDWPTFRADVERSLSVSGSMSDTPSKQWEVNVPGKLSSPVYADGRLYVCSIDSHTVYALNGKNGSVVWSYTAGGRVDTPPTIHKGLVLFGSADGWVYCLCSSDGKLVWRFRASDVDLRMVSYGQIESVWPVPGSILVLDDNAYFASGRSSYIDGGMYLFKLDARSGKVLAQARLNDRDPITGIEPNENAKNRYLTPAVLPDVLSSNGTSIFIRHEQFDLNLTRVAEEAKTPHILCATGFADDSWWQRTSQMYTTAAGTGFGWYIPNSVVPSGRVVALDGDNVVGFGRTLPYSPFDNFAGLNLKRYHIFSMPKKPVVKRTQYETVDWGERIKERTQDVAMQTWSRDVAVRARALLVAGDKMVLAGPKNVLYGIKPKAIEQGRRVIRENVDAFTGMEDGLLEIVATKDGKTLGTVKLDSPPVYHGLILADGALFMTTTAGTVVCLQ
ncbi:MAG: PQQ-binding-like beta-propeller repeat protein [Planctomycetes bacterium]|nr:PQQ-binding-like beta-propeller repeat protein [Planctomycetota bacterium]